MLVCSMLNLEVIRPSGSFLSSVSNSFPRAGTSSEATLPEVLPSSSPLPSEGWERRGGGTSLGCTLCCFLWGFLSSRSTGVQREGWKCYWTLVRCALSSVSSAPSGAGVPGVARCGGCLLPALPRPQSALPSHHCTPCEVMS